MIICEQTIGVCFCGSGLLKLCDGTPSFVTFLYAQFLQPSFAKTQIDEEGKINHSHSCVYICVLVRVRTDVLPSRRSLRWYTRTRHSALHNAGQTNNRSAYVRTC